MLKHYIFTIACLVAIVAQAQFTEPGFYRIHNVGSDRYICIRGTHYKKTSNPDAFWPCIKMLNDPEQITDPGSIVYIPEMGQTSLCAQGVSTYSLTKMWLLIDTATVNEGGKPTYVARTEYNGMPCIFRDYGNGLTAGMLEAPECRWWIEPVNAGSIDTSYLAVKPVCETVADIEGYYWTTMCCDFSIALPVDGGIEGAYTIQDITIGEDGLYYATPVKVYGQGDTVPAATPVLLRCKTTEADGNKIIPVAPIADHTTMPIINDMLMGNYFSNFMNHSSFDYYDLLAEYIPAQATMASNQNLALGVDAEGKLGFFPQEEGTYMKANSAWLSTELMNLDFDGVVSAVYLYIPEPEPVVVTGDANGDGELTIKDVTTLISYLLEGDSDEDRGVKVSLEAADLNGDGQLTIRDVTLLINLLLSTER